MSSFNYDEALRLTAAKWAQGYVSTDRLKQASPGAEENAQFRANSASQDARASRTRSRGDPIGLRRRQSSVRTNAAMTTSSSNTKYTTQFRAPKVKWDSTRDTDAPSPSTFGWYFHPALSRHACLHLRSASWRDIPITTDSLNEASCSCCCAAAWLEWTTRLDTDAMTVANNPAHSQPLFGRITASSNRAQSFASFLDRPFHVPTSSHARLSAPTMNEALHKALVRRDDSMPERSPWRIVVFLSGSI